MLRIDDRFFRVDGISADRNTVYEFNGDYWHGNPEKFDENMYNPKAKATMRELYEKTQKRVSLIEAAGYEIVSIWENDFRNSRKREG